MNEESINVELDLVVPPIETIDTITTTLPPIIPPIEPIKNPIDGLTIDFKFRPFQPNKPDDSRVPSFELDKQILANLRKKANQQYRNHKRRMKNRQNS